MAWNKTTPTSGTPVYNLGDVFADNNAALDSLLSKEHYPLTATGVTSGGGHYPGKVSALYIGNTTQIGALTSPQSGALALDTYTGEFKVNHGTWKAIHGLPYIYSVARPNADISFTGTSHTYPYTVPFSGCYVGVDGPGSRLVSATGYQDSSAVPSVYGGPAVFHAHHLLNLNLYFEATGTGAGALSETVTVTYYDGAYYNNRLFNFSIVDNTSPVITVSASMMVNAASTSVGGVIRIVLTNDTSNKVSVKLRALYSVWSMYRIAGLI
jgi:hypothetical protein